MKMNEYIETKHIIKMGILNSLPINSWNFDGIFEYVKKNYENEYKSLASTFTLSDNVSAKTFCMKALSIEFEPKEKFIMLYDKALKDLTEIENNLTFIELEIAKLNKIKKENGMLNVNDRYELNKLEYFKYKNIKAKDEIIEFISVDLKEYSYNQSIKEISAIGNDPISLFIGDMPYSFSRGIIFSFRDIYNPNSLTDLSNKFLDFPIEEHRNLEKIYSNPKEKKEFFKIAIGYLQGKIPSHPEYNKLQDLKRIIDENHIINRRKDILNNILCAFSKRDFMVVVNMLPLQIEGIFHDICQAYGIEEHLLTISSINKKLELLKVKLGDFYLFEYYAFKFPIIRNQIAHGEIILDELESKAIMLILDLIPVCEMCCKENIPINRKISLVNKINNQNLEPLLDMVNEGLLDITIPSFYNIDESYLTKLDTEEFWELIKSKIKSEKLYLEENKSKLKKFLGVTLKLKDNKIAIKKCDAFRKNLGKLLKKYNEEDRNRKDELAETLKKIGLLNNI